MLMLNGYVGPSLSILKAIEVQQHLEMSINPFEYMKKSSFVCYTSKVG